MQLPKYYEDFGTLHVGTEEPRAYFVPFESAAAALASAGEFCGGRQNSALFQSLNGTWRFDYYQSLDEVPEDVLACRVPSGGRVHPGAVGVAKPWLRPPSIYQCAVPHSL